MHGRVIPKQPVDERVIEQIGSFDPLPNKNNEKMVAINYERVRYWLSQNAKLSHAVGELLGMHHFSLCNYLRHCEISSDSKKSRKSWKP